VCSLLGFLRRLRLSSEPVRISEVENFRVDELDFVWVFTRLWFAGPRNPLRLLPVELGS
jgi:hypothetical protein